jgi:hypothetical protein
MGQTRRTSAFAMLEPLRHYAITLECVPRADASGDLAAAPEKHLVVSVPDATYARVGGFPGLGSLQLANDD